MFFFFVEKSQSNRQKKLMKKVERKGENRGKFTLINNGQFLQRLEKFFFSSF